MSRGASGSISLNSYFNVFILFIVSRASSEYILERLDSSTHFQFAMPRRPDSLNCRPDWTSSLTVICGPSTCIAKKGCISSTAGSSSPPLPGSGLPLASPTIPGKGRTPTGEPSRCKTKNMKPCNTYNVVKYTKDFEKGNTIMKNYRDPVEPDVPHQQFSRRGVR